LAYDPAAFEREKSMGIGFKELLIILAIALLIFGAKRLKSIGSDLGGAVKGFKKAMDEGDDKESKQLHAPDEKDADFDSTPASKAGSKSSNV
jgi:sec-independent protein translocase protein TatA